MGIRYSNGIVPTVVALVESKAVEDTVSFSEMRDFKRLVIKAFVRNDRVATAITLSVSTLMALVFDSVW